MNGMCKETGINVILHFQGWTGICIYGKLLYPIAVKLNIRQVSDLRSQRKSMAELGKRPALVLEPQNHSPLWTSNQPFLWYKVDWDELIKFPCIIWKLQNSLVLLDIPISPHSFRPFDYKMLFTLVFMETPFFFCFNHLQAGALPIYVTWSHPTHYFIILLPDLY